MKTEDFKLKTTKGRHKVMREVFLDIEELNSYLKKAKTNHIFERRKNDLASQSHGTGSFNDFYCFEDAMKALNFGYDTHLDSLNKEMKKAQKLVFKKVLNKNGNYKKDMVGFTPIVPNVIIGNPINMINQNIAQRRIPVCKIIIEKAMLGGVDSEDTIKYFSVFFVLLQLIENKGIRCELWISGTSECGEEIHTFKLKLKDAMQPINIYKLQFPIISADMFRRIGFRLKETTPTMEENWTWGYGSTLINMTRSHYRTTEDYKPNKGMQEILDIDENWVYVPNVEHAKMENKSTEQILKFFTTKTALKDYIKIE